MLSTLALTIGEFEHRRPRLMSRERRKINSRTRIYLFMKASRILLRGVRLREQSLTKYVIRNNLLYLPISKVKKTNFKINLD